MIGGDGRRGRSVSVENAVASGADEQLPAGFLAFFEVLATAFVLPGFLLLFELLGAAFVVSGVAPVHSFASDAMAHAGRLPAGTIFRNEMRHNHHAALLPLTFLGSSAKLLDHQTHQCLARERVVATIASGLNAVPIAHGQMAKKDGTLALSVDNGRRNDDFLAVLGPHRHALSLRWSFVVHASSVVVVVVVVAVVVLAVLLVVVVAVAFVVVAVVVVLVVLVAVAFLVVLAVLVVVATYLVVTSNFHRTAVA